MRAQDFTTRGEQPYGRAMGRSLDALDAQDGFGPSADLPHGPFGLDSVRNPGSKAPGYIEAQARLKAKLGAQAAAKAGARADAAEKARAQAAPVSAPASGALPAAASGFNWERVEANLPLILGVVVVGYLLFKRG